MSRSTDLLSAVVSWVQSLAGIQDAQLGVPKSFGTRVNVYVALGMRNIIDDGGVRVELQDVIVGFAYQIEDAEQDAETTLAAYVDAFSDGYWGHRRAQDGPFNTLTNGGWTITTVPDGSRNSAPQYLDWSRVEVRHWVWITTFKQESTG